ncbi:MAG: hypothetical protein Tsb0010_06880 [Parvularculaceae bacterium]
MTELAQKQKKIGLGMASAAIASAAYFALGYFLWPLPEVAAPALTVFGYALAVAALPLIVDVMRLAQARFSDPELIDGDAPAPGSRFDLDARCLRNTTEQLLLFVCAQAGLAAALEPGTKHIALLYAAWFLFARAAFRIGYHRSPIARSFGFAATFYPTIGVYLALLAWIGYRAIQFASG